MIPGYIIQKDGIKEGYCGGKSEGDLMKMKKLGEKDDMTTQQLGTEIIIFLGSKDSKKKVKEKTRVTIISGEE